MLIAEIRRKLNDLTSEDLTAEDLRRLLSDTKEDLLTADVFGSLKYLPRVPYLSEVLSAIFAPSGDWRACAAEAQDRLSESTFDFWPHYPSPSGLTAGSTEPDVVLSTPDLLIFFEMKLHSGLGERQIERQLAIALQQAQARQAFVVIVSNGLRMPAFLGGEDKTFAGCVRAAKASGHISSELATKLIAESTRILWINWYGIQAALRRAHEEHRLREARGAETVARAADLLSDLDELFRLRGVRPFHGLARVLRAHSPQPFALGLAKEPIDSDEDVAVEYSLPSALWLDPRPFHWSCGSKVPPTETKRIRIRFTHHPFRLVHTIGAWPEPPDRVGLSFGGRNV